MVNINVVMDVMEVIHQELGLIGPKLVLSLDLCMDQITDVKIISYKVVDLAALKQLLLPQLAAMNVNLDQI